MNHSLKSLLDSWNADLDAARSMALLLTQLGLSEDHLPSDRAVRAACLAAQAQGALDRLRSSMETHEEELENTGVLYSGQTVSDLSAGALAVLHSAVPHLHMIKEQLDSILERAMEFTVSSQPVPGIPKIKTGAYEIKGHRHQPAEISVKLERVDRLLIWFEEHELIRVLLFPAEMIRIDVPIIKGELILYAENTFGAAMRRMKFTEVAYV